MRASSIILLVFICFGYLWQDSGATDTSDLAKKLEQLKILAKSSNPDTRLKAITQVRKMLAVNTNPPIDEVIKAGFLPILVFGLQSHYPDIQFESAWALTNIASGNNEQTTAVVDADAVPQLIHLLSSINQKVTEQAAWALANIAGNGAEHRDLCINLGVIRPALRLVRSRQHSKMRRTIVWLLLNLVRKNDTPTALDTVKQLLPTFKQLLRENDEEILSDSLWSFAYITDSGSEYIQAVVDANIVPNLVPFLEHKNPKIVSASLRAIGNVATGNAEQTQTVLDAGALNYMQPLFLRSSNKVKKEVAWFLSNIAAGTVDQIQMLIDADLIPMTVDILIDEDFSTQKEATWTVANIAVSGTSKQVEQLFAHDAVEPLCEMLKVDDAQIVKVTLDALNQMFEKLPKLETKMWKQMNDCNGLETVKKLKSHENKDVRVAAVDLFYKLDFVSMKKDQSNS